MTSFHSSLPWFQEWGFNSSVCVVTLLAAGWYLGLIPSHHVHPQGFSSLEPRRPATVDVPESELGAALLLG
ncbi:hypothetical protein [Arthrobacter sp. ISL-95]|uniref:hypothetical protein n=1 Tax=Arthrobacter sp. ISL-95 TaxID=2819116 RepID=UPI001BEBE57D|nr:hypothetical protein [Arthrobacter sp. ISL-95]MBT2587050.1 hypothetical protein [Arthrobacter sp. ISL-95]